MPAGNPATEADKGSAEEDRVKGERQKKRSYNSKFPPVVEVATTEETTTYPDGRVVTKKKTFTRYHPSATTSSESDPPTPTGEESQQQQQQQQQATETITEQPAAMGLMVKPSTTLQPTRLAVPPHATVGQLKDIIQETLGIPEEHQNLVAAAREQRMTPDDIPLGSFGVVDGSAIHCVVLTGPVRLSVDVSSAGMFSGYEEGDSGCHNSPAVITLDLDETFLVREVKKLLSEAREDFSNSAKYQKLYLDHGGTGTELLDDEALSKYSLGPTATLRLEMDFGGK